MSPQSTYSNLGKREGFAFVLGHFEDSRVEKTRKLVRQEYKRCLDSFSFRV